MVLTLTLPEPGVEKRIKDVVIDILSFEWPLSLIQLHHKIKSSHSSSFSYQAVYKAVNELQEAGVVLRKDKAYSINLAWIDKLKEFSEHITHNYSKSEKIPLIEGVLKTKTENDVCVLTFGSLLELDKTWLRIKNDYYKTLNEKSDITVWEGNHCWWLLVYPEAEYNELERIKDKKVKHLMISHGKNEMDILDKKFYESAGIKFKINEGAVESDMAIFGDTIMQVSLPKELREEIDEIYKKHKTHSEVDLPRFIRKVLKKKVQLNLVLTKNKDIADQLKRKAVSDFR